MALETWLIKVKKSISHSFDPVRAATPPTKAKPAIKKLNVGILAFEVAGLMSKILHLWESLSDKNLELVRRESIRLQGARKIVSNDDAFLLGLACAEIAENLRLVAKSITRLSKKCEDSSLGCFDRLFDEFANTGRDPYNWLLGSKELDSKFKKLDRFVTTTAALHKQIDELLVLENGLQKSLQSKYQDSAIKEQKVIELRQKILWQRQGIKYLKENSLWFRTFDTVTLLLARSVFTVLGRIKFVFGVYNDHPSSPPRSSSASALVHPSENPKIYAPGPIPVSRGFFKLNFEILDPPPSTLGSTALSLHYAYLIIVMEKMIKSPQLIGIDARHDLYSMLPSSVRFALRGRLKGVRFWASDPILAKEWGDALRNVLKWLSPLAHNTIKWQSERSFEQNNLGVKSHVLLLQTLYFANREKAEAAITELLVGLNYIWRFEREMNALLNTQGSC